MSLTLTQSNDAAKGSYRITDVTGTERAVHVGCPDCGTVKLLDDVHITPEGEVRPAFSCACGFQDMLILAGWEEMRPGFPSAQRSGGNPSPR